LAALGAVLRTGHLDSLIADRAFALPDTSDHQHGLTVRDIHLLEAALDRRRHRVDLDLAGTPAERVVVRRGNSAAENVDQEPLVHRGRDDLGPDPVAAPPQTFHDARRRDR